MVSSKWPLWHMDCFKLKAIETLQTQGKLSSPLTTSKNLERGPGPQIELLPERTFCIRKVGQAFAYQTSVLPISL